jgi:aryl-alcohol dehydrogenase-like predicted oxidoreductase
MQYRNLGRTGLRVSPLCLGTMNFGTKTEEADSFRVMDRALEKGINFFDTADVYGWKLGEGITEKIIGRWLAQGGRRDKIVLATKAFNDMGKGPNDRRLSAYHIRRACEDSLTRLKTDHIDLYQMHHVDRTTPWEEIWQAMQTLIKAGKISYVGSSNFAGWHLAQAQGDARIRNMMGLVCEQTKFSLLCRTPELEVIPACQGLGLGFIAWSPLEGGLLAGGAGKAKTGRRAEKWVRKAEKEKAAPLKKFAALARSIGKTQAQLALAWVAGTPGVTGPIIGPRTVEQVDDALVALNIKMTPALRGKLDAIFPGPGGTAPEAYAW